MRDAFGGVFMIRLMLVFVFIYVAFTAISLNYAKAFRIKNKVIDFVEQEEILDLKKFFNAANDKEIKKLDKIITSANYNKSCQGNTELNCNIGKAGDPPICCYKGVVIEQGRTNNNAIYYNVYTYADWNLGVFNMVFALSGQANKNSSALVNGAWEISGEAKVVKRKTAKKK